MRTVPSCVDARDCDGELTGGRPDAPSTDASYFVHEQPPSMYPVRSEGTAAETEGRLSTDNILLPVPTRESLTHVCDS